MKVDAVVLIEVLSDVPKFYPLSLSTPLPLIVCGGLRFIEQAYLRLRARLNLQDVDLVQVVRPHLSVDWSKIIPELAICSLLDVKLRLVTTSFTNMIEILNKYDSVVILPANALPEGLNIEHTCIVRTKNISLRSALNLAVTYSGKRVSSIWELIKHNVDILRETFQLLGLRQDVLNIESDVDSSTRIEGPALLYKCSVRPFTYIRSGTVIYPGAVVGGEVKNSVLDIYAHKEHYGYLGDSYVGRFVNLGAGTTTSNLKNTRGTIKYLGVDTGLRKLGAVIGDFAKTSIGTYIYSGKAIGPYSHVYHIVDIDVPPCTIFRRGTFTRMNLEKLLQFIERDCSKYPVDVELEKRIARYVYYGSAILHEASSHNFTLKLK